MRSISILALILCVLLTRHVSHAQSVFGKWKTYDIFDKSKEESIVEIYRIQDALYIKIDQILPEEHINDRCLKCTDHRKNEPILGMVILSGARLEDGIWQGASILNAKNGKQYGCQISMAGPDLLKVRGYIGYPIFGKTLYWTRVKEKTFQ
jgi:uncharacterized protein (DUF2147 family)